MSYEENKTKGFVTIYRSTQDHWIWQGEKYSRGQAWIDLILSANHKPKSILINSKLIQIQRGQFFTSIRKLAARWQWSKDKTQNYLKLLEKQDMIIRETQTHTGTLITIVNYSKYQGLRETVESKSGHQQGRKADKDQDKERTQTGRRLATNNHVNHDNHENHGNNNIYTSGKPAVVSPKRPHFDYQLFADYWNNNVAGCSEVSRVREPKNWNDSRKKALKNRVKAEGEQTVLKAFDMVLESDFLSGRSGAWQADFDWVLKPAKFQKIIEGQYNNRQKNNEYDSYFDKVARGEA
jgi:hypothetical protein